MLTEGDKYYNHLEHGIVNIIDFSKNNEIATLAQLIFGTNSPIHYYKKS